ncbi:hypothetical protein Bbelb_243470 [Branchiostoma belcheri]|nr:hypothetical protein Bbelb_243470 [Branchiostoma belcheri]
MSGRIVAKRKTYLRAGDDSLTGSVGWPQHPGRLRAPSQNPKLKTCKLADVDSDSPLFVDALGDQGRTPPCRPSLICAKRLAGWVDEESMLCVQVIKNKGPRPQFPHTASES